MMVVLVTALSVLCFVLVFGAIGLVAKAQQTMATSRETARIMADKSLDDDAKEAAVQKAAMSMMKGFVDLVIRIVLVLAAAYVPILLADLTGLVPEADTLAFMLRIDVIVASTVLVIAIVWIWTKVRKS